MQLNRVDISNFRSLKEVEFKFDPPCRILVGINESGKSNILKALSMIAEGIQPDKDDVREPLSSEDPIEDAFVRYVFDLDDHERDEVFESVSNKIFPFAEDNDFVAVDGKKLTKLKKVCQTTARQGLYIIDVLTGSKRFSWWTVPKSLSLAKNWTKPTEYCPAEYILPVARKAMLEYELIHLSALEGVPSNYYEPADLRDLTQLIGKQVIAFVRDNLPSVVVWRYDERNILPGVINLSSFEANPEICVPLKNMFMLAGIPNISEELGRAKTSQTKLRNLLKRVATHTTNHFKSVWKDYDDIQFDLQHNGDNIQANLLEENYWSMSQRSDGIKRFMAFLLYVSANVKSKNLQNALLLVDEPDMGLHPSGSRYLRDELIQISNDNYVVFSTHSIFMIDKENIDRHVIVKKKGEITKADTATKSNFIEEEVLYNALNISTFDILKLNNLVFEGWRDKQLFQAAIKEIPAERQRAFKSLLPPLQKIGTCHVEGVKDVRNLSPVLELAGRECIILSDADRPAKEKKSEFAKLHGYGEWYCYDDLIPDTQAQSGEDFLSDAAYQRGIALLKDAHNELTGDPPLVKNGRIRATQKWLTQQNVSQENIKLLLNELKEFLFDEIKPSDVDDHYYDYLEKLAERVSLKAKRKTRA